MTPQRHDSNNTNSSSGGGGGGGGGNGNNKYTTNHSAKSDDSFDALMQQQQRNGGRQTLPNNLTVTNPYSLHVPGGGGSPHFSATVNGTSVIQSASLNHHGSHSPRPTSNPNPPHSGDALHGPAAGHVNGYHSQSLSPLSISPEAQNLAVMKTPAGGSAPNVTQSANNSIRQATLMKLFNSSSVNMTNGQQSMGGGQAGNVLLRGGGNNGANNAASFGIYPPGLQGYTSGTEKLNKNHTALRYTSTIHNILYVTQAQQV